MENLFYFYTFKSLILQGNYTKVINIKTLFKIIYRKIFSSPSQFDVHNIRHLITIKPIADVKPASRLAELRS